MVEIPRQKLDDDPLNWVSSVSVVLSTWRSEEFQGTYQITEVFAFCPNRLSSTPQTLQPKRLLDFIFFCSSFTQDFNIVFSVRDILGWQWYENQSGCLWLHLQPTTSLSASLFFSRLCFSGGWDEEGVRFLPSNTKPFRSYQSFVSPPLTPLNYSLRGKDKQSLLATVVLLIFSGQHHR